MGCFIVASLTLAFPASAQSVGTSAVGSDATLRGGRVDPACDALQTPASAPKTPLFIARCAAQQGRTAEAYGIFRDIARVPGPWQAEAERWRLGLQPTLVVRVLGTSPALTTVDGSPVPSEKEVSVEPGEHLVTVILDKQAFRERRVIAEAGKVTTIQFGPSDPRTPAGIGLLSAGVIGVIGVIVTAVIAGAKKDVVDTHCTADKHCDAAGQSAAETGQKLVIFNTVSWAMAAGGLGLGSFFLFTSRGSVETTAAPRVPEARSTGYTFGFGGRF